MSRDSGAAPCAYHPADCDPSASDSGYVGNPVKRQMRLPRRKAQEPVRHELVRRMLLCCRF